jgi:hypothetical protein
LSNPDSFIDEVTEVRRDHLFRLFRKYGWIGVVIIFGPRHRHRTDGMVEVARRGSGRAFGDR